MAPGDLVVVMVTGAVPGLGKSTLSRRIARDLRRAGLAVELFEESHILERPEFATVMAEFRSGRAATPDQLLDATEAYLRG